MHVLWYSCYVSLSYPFEDNTIWFQYSELIKLGWEGQLFLIVFCGNLPWPILLKKVLSFYIYNFCIQSVELSSYMTSWNRRKGMWWCDKGIYFPCSIAMKSYLVKLTAYNINSNNRTTHPHSAFTWLAKSFQYLQVLTFLSHFFQFTGVMRRASSSYQ